MSLGVSGNHNAPLHELEAAWKAGAEPAPGQVVAEPCLCGGVIKAMNNERAIAYSVRIHNESPKHVQWAIRAGWR